MKNWSFHKFGEKADNWPKNENGEPVDPVFLEHVSGSEIDVRMEINMLTAFGMPVLFKYPNDGEFAKVIMGYAPTGTDIYVPETMLEDAKNIISCDMSDADSEITEGE